MLTGFTYVFRFTNIYVVQCREQQICYRIHWHEKPSSGTWEVNWFSVCRVDWNWWPYNIVLYFSISLPPVGFFSSLSLFLLIVKYNKHVHVAIKYEGYCVLLTRIRVVFGPPVVLQLFVNRTCRKHLRASNEAVCWRSATWIGF